MIIRGLGRRRCPNPTVHQPLFRVLKVTVIVQILRSMILTIRIIIRILFSARADSPGLYPGLSIRSEVPATAGPYGEGTFGRMEPFRRHWYAAQVAEVGRYVSGAVKPDQ